MTRTWKVRTADGKQYEVEVAEHRSGERSVYALADEGEEFMLWRDTPLMLVAAIADQNGWAAVHFIAPGETD